jgi:hypothetical protein
MQTQPSTEHLRETVKNCNEQLAKVTDSGMRQRINEIKTTAQDQLAGRTTTEPRSSKAE